MLNNLIQHAMMGYQNAQLGARRSPLTQPAAGETSLLLVGTRGFVPVHALSDLVSSLQIATVLDAPTFAEAMAQVQGHQPAWIVFDADMARTRSASEIAAFVGAMNGAVVVGICRDATPERDEQRLWEGVAGFIDDASALPMILNAIRVGLNAMTQRAEPANEPTPTLAPTMTVSAVTETTMHTKPEMSLDAELQLRSGKSRLTARQLQVLARLSMGESNHEIGRLLGISVKTVKVHVGQIYKLLGVNNRTRATIAAGRMAEVREQQSEEAARGPIRFSWLFPYAELRKYRAGQVVFRKGDAAKEMFYVRTGLVHLKETGKQLAQDDLFGEIGVFMPEHRRTATVECVTATQLYAISAESVMRLYMQNPQFALLIFQLTARRLDEDRARRSSH